MESASPIGSADVLRLTQTALERFDLDPLEATVRRAARIASLLGESRIAVRLGLELKPTGGHPPANAEMTRRLMADPKEWNDPDGPAERALNDWMAGRKREDGKILAFSIAELLFWRGRQIPDNDVPAAEYASHLQSASKMVEIETRIRHETFTCLCQWERRLSFAATQQRALDSVSTRVDSLLTLRAPDVLDQFNVAFRRLREAETAGSQASSSEALSQCLASCRRILKAIVDVVQPADSDRGRSHGGHALTDAKYKNRLFEFLNTNIASASYLSAAQQDANSLHERFAAVDALSSKGVHAEVARSEAEFVALHTYLLAGQILSLTEAESRG